MKIGVIINYSQNKEIGGGYTYFSRIVKLISNYTFEQNIEIVFLTGELDSGLINSICINVEYKPLSYYFFRVLGYIFSLLRLKNSFTSRANKIVYAIHEEIFRSNDIDILYYPTPSLVNYNYPYISTCWDLGHKSTYSFPEVALNNSFISRKKFVSDVYENSFAIICESEAGKSDLVFYERINPNRIFVLPMIPGPVVDLSLSEKEINIYLSELSLLGKRYFYYPAQFWSHKNHINLLIAFKSYISEHSNTLLVFSGSDKGNLEYIRLFILENELQDNVIILGFVSVENVFALYKASLALIYPSLLGPTNMPLLEAYILGVPVITSNLQGHREQLGDYAEYFDPLDPIDILDKMLNFKVKNLSLNFENNTGKILGDHFKKINQYRITFGNNFNQF
jgi:glycosyltransferase involved in cell wall biosynthesis